MIRKLEVGRKVVILDSSKCCCSPHESGKIGEIRTVTEQDCITVHVPGKGTWWHCSRCLGPYKKRSLK